MMKWKTFVIGYALALALLLFAQHRPEGKQPATFSHIVDLTHRIGRSSGTELRGSGYHSLQAKPIAAVTRSGSARSSAVEFPTRVDAPARAAKSLWTVDQIPPERLFAPLAVIDVRPQVRRNPDYQLSVTDIANWEQQHGEIPLGAVVVARTGWAGRWASPADYRNRDGRGMQHFPGISLQAARFLVEGRKIVGLGIDTAAIDAGNMSDSMVRDFVLAHSVYEIENMANLGQAPEIGGLVLVAPAKLQGSSSAPVRVLALAK